MQRGTLMRNGISYSGNGGTLFLNGKNYTNGTGTLLLNGVGYFRKKSDYHTKVKIETVSTGGYDASIRIYSNYDKGVYNTQKVYGYKELNTTQNFDGLISVNYGTTMSLNYVVTALTDIEFNGQTYSAGSRIVNWQYSTSISDYVFEKV